MKKRKHIRRWIRWAFLLWATFVLSWLANAMRTRGVDSSLMLGNENLAVVDSDNTLEFNPKPGSDTALIFICGSGVSAKAYVPLLRPIADAGYPVVVVKLPFRFAPLESHKKAAIDRVFAVMTDQSDVTNWVLAGHSLGGALACRSVLRDPKAFFGMVLVGTTHPKLDDLSFLQIPVTKVYASNDEIAPLNRIEHNMRLLPKNTRLVQIDGGNHSQFGNYGHQPFDGKAAISREEQQEITRSALLEMLNTVEEKKSKSP